MGNVQRNTALLVALVAGLTLPLSATDLVVDVLARSMGPGELLRVDVTASDPVGSLEGEFLEQHLSFIRTARMDGRERWSAWAMVGLLQDPGEARLTIRGLDTAGTPLGAARVLAIRARSFPEEHLAVAPRFVDPPPEVAEQLARERKRLGEIYATRRPAFPARGPFVRPVPGGPTSVFGTRRIYNGEPRSPHPGLDLRAPTGTPVVASGPGRIVLAQDLYYSGNTVIVDHGAGLFTLYAHLSAIEVEVGQDAQSGERIGLSGATGRVTGPHLHWGAKIGNRPFDPRALLDDALFD